MEILHTDNSISSLHLNDPRDLTSNNDLHVYLVAEFDDMPSGISKE